MVYPGVSLKKTIGPQKFKKSGLVLPAFLKTGKVAGNALA